jgi:hypothetical protein
VVLARNRVEEDGAVGVIAFGSMVLMPGPSLVSISTITGIGIAFAEVQCTATAYIRIIFLTTR